MTKNDSDTAIEELRVRLGEFVRERDWEKFHNPKNIAESICIEAGELMEVFQWRSEHETANWKFDQEKKDRIGEELADVIIYSLNMANAMDIDVAQAVLSKIEQNEEKYPVDSYYGRAD
ncbi:MAG: nucleotide pyrophosphohydrolase [Candidatus Hadarchaeota archaeon]